MAGKTASYRKDAVPGGARFYVTPAGSPQPWLFVLGFGFFALAALWGFLVSHQIIMLLIAAGLGFATWKTWQSGTKGREPVSFDVTPEGITHGNIKIDRPQLHGLRIENDISHEQTVVPMSASPTIVVGGLLPGAALVQHGTSITRPHLERAAAGYKKLQREVSWRVDAEAGGVATRLAGGMDQVTARGLATDVQRALDPDT